MKKTVLLLFSVLLVSTLFASSDSHQNVILPVPEYEENSKIDFLGLVDADSFIVEESVSITYRTENFDDTAYITIKGGDLAFSFVNGVGDNYSLIGRSQNAGIDPPHVPGIMIGKWVSCTTVNVRVKDGKNSACYITDGQGNYWHFKRVGDSQP